jgi:hypothetical protein
VHASQRVGNPDAVDCLIPAITEDPPFSHAALDALHEITGHTIAPPEDMPPERARWDHWEQWRHGGGTTRWPFERAWTRSS